MFGFLKNLFGGRHASLVEALGKGAVVIDVRMPSEYKQGHIQHSKNIPVNELRSKLDTIRKWNKPVITVCQSGGRSAVAKTLLVSSGIEAYNGGSWTNLKKYGV